MMAFAKMFKDSMNLGRKAAVESGNHKDDTDKLDYGTMPREVMRYVYAVRTYGNIKYEHDSWKDVPKPIRRYASAAERHWDAIVLDKEVMDKESGLPHIAHWLTCQIFIAWFVLRDQQLISED